MKPAASERPAPFAESAARLLRRPRAVLATATALLLLGVWTAVRAPLEWLPRVELPEVVVEASWAGASPRAVERYVTAPLERAAQDVSGTASVESYSAPGYAVIRMGVRPEADLAVYTAEVRERMALARPSLPEGVVPRVSRSTPAALRERGALVTLQLGGTRSPTELRTLAEDRLAPRLERVPGVGSVEVQGGRSTEVAVLLDADRLVAYGLTAEAVAGAVRAATAERTYGRLLNGDEAPLLQRRPVSRLAEIERLPLRTERGLPPLQIRDIAMVRKHPAPARSLSRVDGEPAITLSVARAPGSDVLRTAADLRTAVHALGEQLSEDVQLRIAADESEEVRRALDDLAWRGGLGLALVGGLLALILGSLRAAGGVLLTAAVALAATLAAMPLVGLALNLFTLAGLVLLFGLLVDNAAVVAEQTLADQRRGRETSSRYTAVTARTLTAVWPPLLGGTLTTAAILVPLAYLSGDLRAAFLPLGVLTGLALSLSLLSAALLAPTLLRPARPPAPATRPLRGRFRRLVLTLGLRPYRVAARHPRLTLVLLALLLGFPMQVLPRSLDRTEPVALVSLYEHVFGHPTLRPALDVALGGVLRPFIEHVRQGRPWGFGIPPEVEVRIGLASGGNLAQADSLARLFERMAVGAAPVQRVLTEVREREALLRVRFRPETLDTDAPYLLRDQLINRAARLAGVDLTVSGLLPTSYRSAGGADLISFSVEAQGPHYDTLDDLVRTLADRLSNHLRVAGTDVHAGPAGRRPEDVLTVRLDPDASARTGITARTAAGALAPLLAWRTPALHAVLEGEVAVPIHVYLDGAEHADTEDLRRMPLRSAGTTTPLDRVARLTITPTPPGIERVDQVYRRFLRIDYRGPPEHGRELVEREIEALGVPPGYRLRLPDGSFFADQDPAPLLWLVLGTVGFVCLITALIFDSWLLALVVVLSIPTAVVGVGAGFLLSGAYVAEGALIGVVLLVGVAANDSILLGYRYRQLRLVYGRSPGSRLVLQALRHRLRPMWATTLSTAAGMAPLLWADADGAFWIGLSTTVIGGLIAATLLAPLATVALLSLGRR